MSKVRRRTQSVAGFDSVGEAYRVDVQDSVCGVDCVDEVHGVDEVHSIDG